MTLRETHWKTSQNDLAHIIRVLRDEFEQVTGFATGKKKHSRILKIILFGSHATGKWVKDPAHGVHVAGSARLPGKT